MTQSTIPLVKVGMPASDVLMPALERTLYGGMLAEGEQVYEFERRCATAFGLPRVLAMSSGTGALHASLYFAGVRPGDEVISTPITAEPTNVAVLHVGGTVVWSDVDPRSGNADPAAIERAITPRTKAILIVHYAGYPVDMEGVMAVSHRHGIPVIEDCAHAIGARSAGQPVGTHGDFSIFSFQAIKHMTTVDGGLLAFRDSSLEDNIKRFRWFGMDKGVARTNLDVSSVGWKYNMNNVTATIGLCQLDTIDQRVAAHIENGHYYDRAFAGMRHVAPAHFLDCDQPSYWLYTLLCDDSDAVEKALQAEGIGASKLHRRNDLHSLFASSRRPLPGADEFARRYLHLPVGWWVTPEDRDRIVKIVERAA